MLVDKIPRDWEPYPPSGRPAASGDGHAKGMSVRSDKDPSAQDAPAGHGGMGGDPFARLWRKGDGRMPRRLPALPLQSRRGVRRGARLQRRLLHRWSRVSGRGGRLSLQGGRVLRYARRGLDGVPGRRLPRFRLPRGPAGLSLLGRGLQPRRRVRRRRMPFSGRSGPVRRESGGPCLRRPAGPGRCHRGLLVRRDWRDGARGEPCCGILRGHSRRRVERAGGRRRAP